MRWPMPARASPACSAMRAGDIVFTSGGTEANNLAIKGIAIAAQLEPRTRGHVVTTPIEHESILESVDYLARVHGFEVTHVPVDAHGRVSTGCRRGRACATTRRS